MDPTFFESPEHAFQVRGCDVFTAMSGADALAFIQSHGASLVICRGLPQGVAPQTLHAALGPDSHMVLICGKDDDAKAVETWKKLGGVHVVEEPISGKSLLKLTARLMAIPNRKYISILVQVKVQAPKPTTIFGKSRDISEHGVLVETNQTIGLHETVVVSFLIPGADRMIQSQALVAREVDAGGGTGRRYGLKFLNLSEEEQRIVAEYLSGQPTRMK